MSTRHYLGILVLICMAIWLTYALVINPLLKNKAPVAGSEMQSISSIKEQLRNSCYYLASFIPLFEEILKTFKNELGLKVNFDLKDGTISFFNQKDLLLTMCVTGEVGAPNTLHLNKVKTEKIENALHALLKKERHLLKWSYTAQGNRLIETFLYVYISK